MDFNKEQSYHEKLNIDKWDSWSEEALSKFLAYDYFEGLNESMGGKDNQALFCGQQELIIQKYKKYKTLLDFLDKIFFKIYFISAKNKKSILFRNPRYSSVISGAKKQYHVGFIVQGFADRLFAWKSLTGYISTTGLYQYLFDYFKDKDIKYLYQLVKEIEDRLKTAKPDFVVLGSDAPPMEKAIVLACKKLGITTLTIQHGIYASVFPLDECKFADYVLVWGNHFKNLLYSEQKLRKPEDVYILGYPSLIKKTKLSKREGSKYRVCYLGQPYEKYNKDLSEIKIETINGISGICKNLGLEFIYRPHPAEDRNFFMQKLPGIRFTDKNEELEKTFEKSHILISSGSTALIQAAMRQKICLQLLNYPVKLDNFEELGVCNKTLNTMEELEKYLAEITAAENLDKFRQEFNNDYIEIRHNPSQRFLEIIREIEKQKKYAPN